MDKIPVNEKALFRRLERRLFHDNLAIHRCGKRAKAYPQLGSYYTIDTKSNSVDRVKLDLADLAIEYGCLKQHEIFAG